MAQSTLSSEAKLEAVLNASSSLRFTILEAVCKDNADTLNLAYDVFARAKGLKAPKRKLEDDATLSEKEAKREETEFDGMIYSCCEVSAEYGVDHACKSSKHWATDDPRGPHPPTDSEVDGNENQVTKADDKHKGKN
jgi:hypothetical protein